MTLKTRITDDMKDAMRAHQVERLSTIRLLLAAIKQREVDERKELTDADILAVLDKMVKQRRDSITQFEAALRRFKRTIEKTGLLTELRAREFYEKPTAERKRKKAAAVKRHYKRIRSQQLPPKLF